MFEVDQRICRINEPGIRGRIGYAHLNNNYDVIWDNGDIETINGSELQNEVIELTPWERLANNEFDNYQNFTISSIINKIRNTSANTISTLKASKTIFKPYQFIPLLKLLQSENKRIIIADEVGLGKTISAGHIILELAARGELKNMLVVCLNSIQDKWVDELENRFNVRLKKFESVKEFKKALLESNENGEEIFGVINYEKIRSERNMEFFQENAIEFDLLIFDEAHTLRNDTKTRKSIKQFSDKAKSIVMLTATPIMTSLENLYNLVKLLDEDTYSKYQIFQNAININKPFIRAYNQLNANINTKRIANELKETKVENLFQYGEFEHRTWELLGTVLEEDYLYKNLLKKLEGTQELTHETKAQLQEMLINLNSLNHFYTRTRKRDVTTKATTTTTKGNIVSRNPSVIEIEMNESERAVYERVMDSVEEGLEAVQIKRKYSSSLFANDFKEEEFENKNTKLDFEDGKFSALLDVISQQKEKRIIVFAFFRKTLLYLKNRLSLQGINAEVIFGGVNVEERNKIIERFENNEFQILLSSEVGSTGLDMQFCDCMVNYDLPWNPMVVEQRIGRIDRIGQQAEVINIFNFIYKDTIEQKIYHRLYARIKIFEESLGNLDEILGEKEMFIEKTIERLFKRNLSSEETKKTLDQMATAIETNKLHMHSINEGLRDSFSNDFYFSNEINKIEKNNQYITELDLIEFIERGIGNILTTLIFKPDENNPMLYILKQPKEDVVYNFMDEYYDKSNQELKKMLRTFRTRNRDKIIKCTFNQELTLSHKVCKLKNHHRDLYFNPITKYKAKLV